MSRLRVLGCATPIVVLDAESKRKMSFDLDADAVNNSRNLHEYDIVYFALHELLAAPTDLSNQSEQQSRGFVARYMLQRLIQYVQYGGVLLVEFGILRLEGDKAGSLKLQIRALLQKLGIPTDVISHSGSRVGNSGTVFMPLFKISNGSLAYNYVMQGKPQSEGLTADGPGNPYVAYLSKPFTRGAVLILPKLLEIFGGEEQWRIFETTIGIAEKLNKSSSDRAISLPVWTKDYMLPGEDDLNGRIERALNEIASTQQQLTQMQAELSTLESHKYLFVGFGSALEAQVDWALEVLGFSNIVRHGNRTDRTATRDGKSIVIEIKGKVRSSEETKDLAQLMKWEGEFLAERGSLPKCLLIVNAFRDEDLQDRTRQGHAPAFPDNLVKTAEARGYTLITGHQLLNLALQVLDQPESADKLATLLFETRGTLSGFGEWPVKRSNELGSELISEP